MYLLHLRCTPDEADLLSAELFDAGAAGIQEIESERSGLLLVAVFETNIGRDDLLQRFGRFSPAWSHENDTDWVQATQRAWPARKVGAHLFLAPPWSTEPTPSGRKRVIHNPGLACGTGEHPCTQLALEALERVITPACSIADIGTGSGILAISAQRLGATISFGIDVDEAALHAASENFELNALTANLVIGSADCLLSRSVDVVVANINATVLLALADDLLSLLRPNGALILTGFPVSEAAVVREVFNSREMLERHGWSCAISRLS